jgi:thiamine-phosphate pyrophosphorylase
MPRRYNACMTVRQQSLPKLWLVSDWRNDSALETVLGDLPPESGFIYRHYHLEGAERRARFEELAQLCRFRGHMIVLSGDCATAAEWNAAGAYGALAILKPHPAVLRFATVHDAAEIAQANHAQVDAMLLSPVFPTRSHPGGAALGQAGFHALAALANCPVIALGGMNPQRAADLGWDRWAAIDGLSGNIPICGDS